jgi:hypothetical protein
MNQIWSSTGELAITTTYRDLANPESEPCSIQTSRPFFDNAPDSILPKAAETRPRPITRGKCQAMAPRASTKVCSG